jgi:Rrf2 family cysteine metabolism transcriptional repressor
MKLTTKSEYSLLALIYIARHKKEPYVKVADICAAYSIPKKYLESLLNALMKNGFVKAKRGAEGGYRLAREPKTISVAMIVRLMDGALAPTESVSVYFYSETPLQKEQKVIDLLRTIRDYTARVLEGTSLADLV